MKKKLLITISIVIVVLLTWMGYSSVKKLEKKAESENIMQKLDLLAMNLKLQNADASNPLVFIYFNSDCHFCQWEMKELQENIEKFKSYQLMLASFEPKEDAINFLTQHNLSKYYVYVNPDVLTSTIIGGVPQTFIYQDGQLKKHFRGEVKIEAILEVLK